MSPANREKPGQEGTAPAVPYIDVRETHTGVVVLAGDRAFKAKKPLLTDFVDFRTAEQRERACRREIELNSRLAPGSYLGLAHLSDPAGGQAEPVVVMRRYDDSRRLASLAAGGARGDGSDGALAEALDTIAGILARFHDRTERGPLISAQGEAGAVLRRWRDNLTELHRFAGASADCGVSGDALRRIAGLVDEFVSGRGPLFGHRIQLGCIVDGHADLLADDIFLVDGEPALLDCLEFDDQLRYVDRIDDAACLAMDLEFLGRKDLGDLFLQRYVAHSGDSAPTSLSHFYIAYRAGVRAKVDCLRQSQGRPDAGADAARHIEIATRHLEDGAIRLALVGGGPGTGKSTIARALAESVGARVISTDDVRVQLRESGAIGGERGVLDAGLYSAENVAAVYREALRRADELLGGGHSVILDGTWQDPRLRADARRVGAETHSRIVEYVCATPVAATADRIRTRAAGNSDATPEIAAALAARRDDWDGAHRIDTTGPLEGSVRKAHDVWRQAI